MIERERERRAMVYSSYAKQRIVHYHEKRYKPPTIQRLLLEEGLVDQLQKAFIHVIFIYIYTYFSNCQNVAQYRT